MIIALYLGSALVLGLAFWPKTRETKALQAQLDQLKRDEENYLRVMEQKPILERKQRELEQRLSILSRDVPSQYDLPEALDFITRLASFYDLKVEDLTHIPLKHTPGEKSGVIPLTLQVLGSDSILPYLVHLQTELPSLQLTSVILGYLGDRQYGSEITADLHVLIKEQAAGSNWVEPSKYTLKPSLVLTGFGLPFEIVSKFLGDQVRVLGVVEGNAQSSALVAKDGTKRWVKVGDRLGDAIVTSIQAGGITLNVDGVLLKLTIGGLGSR